MGVRPEAWRLVSENEGGLPVRVTVVEELGADAFVYGSSGVEGAPNNIIVRVSARDSVRKVQVLFRDAINAGADDAPASAPKAPPAPKAAPAPKGKKRR